MIDTPDNKLYDLSWYRLHVSVINTRMVPKSTAHPLSIFQAMVKGVTLSLGANDGTAIDPFFHLVGRRYVTPLRQGDRFDLVVLFCNHPLEYAESWREAFFSYLEHPETGKNFALLDLAPLERRTLTNLEQEHPDLPHTGELCLDFLTPLPFTPERHRHRTFLDRNRFVQMFSNRLSRLFGCSLGYRPNNDNFELLSYYWNFTEIRHPSRSQAGQTQILKGCAGKLYLRGDFTSLRPWLLLASELNLGTKIPSGQGYFTFLRGEVPFLARNFPHRKAMLAATREVLEQYDNAAESLALTEPAPFNEESLVENLCRELGEGTYQPTPTVAFNINKRNGGKRTIEQLCFRDLIVQQYLLRLISTTFDKFFEPGSIGFRRGISRQAAIDKIHQALSEGYTYVIESDIEDFFPSIDHDLLDQLLLRHLPLADVPVRRMLMTCVRTGSNYNGKFVERNQGLGQGAPLSPTLANLYLDSFDEKVTSWNVRMVRYADDFVILTRTAEDAQRVLERSSAFLDGLGLSLNHTKTAIGHISRGITFLGIRFDGAETEDRALADNQSLYKKPLYITEPYVMLALNGESLDVIRQRKIIASLPMRRISEVLVMEKATFSTALIKKCADLKIPLTITLNSGYFVATIKPDSKQYFAVAHSQAQRFEGFSETECLWFAKEFAAGKLANYMALFKQRCDKKLPPFIHELERVIDNINLAGNVNQVRGYEGSATKKIYRHLNYLIDNQDFHIQKRGRFIRDPINSLLNFSYYLLFSRVNTTVRALGLNPYLGFLHSHNDNYESLVCDIEELFRPRINRVVIRCINLGVIKKIHFFEKETRGGKRLFLDKVGTKKFLQQFEADLDRKNSKNELSLKEEIHIQCSKIKEFMTGGRDISFYRWRV